MRHYTADEERKIRLGARLGDWTGAGLIDDGQARQIESRLATDLRRTKWLLRAALAAFTAIVVVAAAGLLFLTFNIHGELEVSVTLALAALVCSAGADYLVRAMRFYRHGVEEMLAASSVVMLAVAALAFANAGGRGAGNLDSLVALVVAAAAAAAVYARYGFVYAAVAAVGCAAAVPFTFDLSTSQQRACVAAVFAAVFIVARTLHRAEGDDYPGDDYALVAAAACAGAYLALNLHAFDDVLGVLWRRRAVDGGWFYWLTYAATWVVPAAALTDAIRAKDRALLATGIVLALVTLATNKPYLGVARQTWDPMLLGVLLAGGAIALRRWLAAGAGGARNGYTADRVGPGGEGLLQIAANTSVAWHGRLNEPPASDAAAPGPFDGGRSGGGGSSETF
jgi:hypothetical protein